MKLAREHGVPVLLQGQGGDELFWGYPQLREAAEATLKKDRLLRAPFARSLSQSLKLNFPKNRSLNNVFAWARDVGGFRSNRRNVRRQLETPDRMIFYDASPDFRQASAQALSLYSRRFSEQIDADDVYSLFTFPGEWKSVETTLTALICATYLRENGIAQGDRLGMASSVEMRLPLVDYKFVETIVGLRKKQSDAKLPPKHWLRAAAKDVLPDWVLNRPKRGFAPPTREWHDALFAAYGDSLRDGYLVESNVLSGESGLRLAKENFLPKRPARFHSKRLFSNNGAAKCSA